MSNAVCAQNIEEGVVFPLNLQKELFLVGAVDNIDHNTSSMTSKDSFHGTAISLIQFPDDSSENISRNRKQLQKGQKNIISLPQFYSQVNPVTSVSEPKVPQSQFSFHTLDGILTNQGDQQIEWLHEIKVLLEKDTLGDDEFISLAAF